MTPGSRIGIGLLFALLVVGMFLLFSGKVVQSGQYLFGGESFSRTQIQLMEAAFAEEGLSDWTVEGSRVKIKGNKSDYIAALVKHKAMPAGCYDEMDEALANMGIMDLPDKVKESIKNANIKSLEQMISGLHAIEKAKVLCYREKTHNFSGVDRCSAIVTVKPALGESIDAKLAKTVQEMAARGLGIPMADISVTDDSTSHSFSVDLSSGEIASNQLKSEYETEWERKIRELLNIAGITVAVNVELDPYESRRELKFTPDKKPVTKSSYNKTSKVDRKAPAPGGRPGFSSNQPNRLVQTATQMSTDTENNNENIQDNVIGRMNEEVSYATGRQKQVNVSIHIPSDHYAKVWKSRNPTPEGEEAKEPTPAELATIETETVAKAKQSVANLLSAVGGDKAADWVYVATKDSLALPPVEEPGMVAMAAGWFETVLDRSGVVCPRVPQLANPSYRDASYAGRDFRHGSG